MLRVDDADLVQLREGLVVPRMSGAPVLNLRTGRVIGHIKRTSDERVPTGGWVVHCRSWLEQLSEVRERHDAYHRGSRRWRDARARRLAPHLRPATQPLPIHDRPPSAALAPEYGLVAFSGRGEELAALHDWCDEPDGLGVRVLVGAGGVGKSRLAAELCAQREGLGWITGTVDVTAPLTILADVRAIGDPALVVIDYAESARDLAESLRLAAAKESDAPLRVLLLARSASEWWEALCEAPERMVRQAALRHPPRTLRAQLDENSTVNGTVAHAARCFAAALSRPCPELRPLPREAAEWPVLSLHTWALVAVLSADVAVSNTPPPAETSLLWRELLGHEARYWRATARRAHLSTVDATALRRCVGLLALLGTTSEQQIVRALRRVPELSDANELLRHQIARWLRDVYPGQSRNWLGTLAPDLLAEHHVVEQLTAAPEFAHRALNNLPTDQAVHALTVLGRAMAHRSDAAVIIAEALAADLPRLALPAVEAARRTGPGLGRLLAQAVASSPPSPLLFEKLTRNTPARSEALRDLRVVLLRRDLGSAEKRSLQEADLQIDLGRLLVLAGDHRQSRDLALAALRTVERHEPAGARTRRASCLLLLGQALDGLGHILPALEAMDAAVALFRNQFLSQASTDTVELADALIVRSHMLTNADEAATAELAAREAIAVLKARPTSSSKWRLASARAQTALAMALWRSDRHEQDLESSRTAVNVLRALADQDADQHLSELGVALDQLGVRLSELNQHEEAIHHTREAVLIFRKLTVDNPVLYSNLLAVALHNLAVRLGEHNRHEEALERSREAVDLRRRLVTSAASRVHLIRSLQNLAGHLNLVGHREDSLAAVEEAIGLSRWLASEHGDRFARELGHSLQTLAAIQAGAGAFDAALPNAKQAVAVLRSSEEGRPGRVRWTLAQALRTLASVHLGHHDVRAALVASEEAAEHLLELAELTPHPYASQAVTSLLAVVVLLDAPGASEVDVEAARQAAARSIAALRRCEVLAAGCATAALAQALESDARRALKGERLEQALEAAVESVALARVTAERGADVAQDLLPRCLHTLAVVLLSTGRRLDALNALTECVTVGLQPHGANGREPLAFGRSLGLLGKVERSVGRQASAAEHLSDAIAWLTQALDSPETDLAETRLNLFEVSSVCLQTLAGGVATRATVACALIALGTSEDAPAGEVAAALRTLSSVVSQDPGAAAAWREIVGQDPPSLLTDVASGPPSARTHAGTPSLSPPHFEQKVVNVARRFGDVATRLMADGERALDGLRALPGDKGLPATTLVPLVMRAERLGLRSGLRTADLLNIGSQRLGCDVEALLVRDLANGLLHVAEDRVRLIPYLAAAAAWRDDLAAPTLDLWEKAVTLAAKEDLLHLADNADVAGVDHIADAALARGVELGSSEAMSNLAFRLFRQGRLDEAWPLYESSAFAGVPESMVTLGVLLATRREFDAAERWLRKAAAHGHARGMASLAGLLQATERASEARHWALLSAEAGDPFGMRILGRAELSAGNQHGKQWLSAAADRGSVGAMRDLGEHLLELDPRRGEEWLRRAAVAGDCMAGTNLVAHLQQQGRDPDDELMRCIAESVDHKLGAEGGEVLVTDDFRPYVHALRVTSMLELGKRALDRRDYDLAETWLARALRAQVPAQAAAVADHLLGQLEKRRDLTVMWVALAESGQPEAMYNAGLCFWHKEQFEEAERWWRRGAEAGDVECYNKVGVVQAKAGNAEEAERWFSRAAKHEDPVGMFNLGVFAYQRGAVDEGLHWLRRAREAGHEGASKVLEQLDDPG